MEQVRSLLVLLSPLIANPSCFSPQVLLVSNPRSIQSTPERLLSDYTEVQSETVSPNYFTAAFLSHDFFRISFQTLPNRRSHPQLFTLIVEHLAGYNILPFGAFSTAEIYELRRLRSKNLRKDAQIISD